MSGADGLGPAGRPSSAQAARTVAERQATWIRHAQDALAEAGHRRGGARRAVIEVLGRQRCAVSAHDVEAALHREGRMVGRASVYRTLERLEELRLVQRVELGGTTARYEPHHPDGEHHHHLVCDSCGQVTPFEDPELERTIARVSERVSFAVAEHDIVLHGACATCAD